MLNNFFVKSITKASSFLITAFLISNSAWAEANRLGQIYFKNDSLNGLFFSDAYETHNMGVKVIEPGWWAKLDLSIVSPDMHVYKNEYRNADRSYGELVTLEYGKTTSIFVSGDEIFGRVTIIDNFGLSDIQSKFHEIFKLQKVGQLNNTVRMPSNTHVGLGYTINSQQNSTSRLKNNFLSTTTAYAGTSKAYIDYCMSFPVISSFGHLTLGGGATFVAYDKITSAPPVEARTRHFIPRVELKWQTKIGNQSFFIKDEFSLPKIADNSKVFGVLSSGIQFTF